MRFAWTSAVLLATGCATTDLDPEYGESAFGVALSASDAALVLDLANYPGASEAVLDDAVGLDARAARGIAAARAGVDGVFPSADDELFADVAELDAVPFVGDAAFERLLAYAKAHPAPAGETVEGVTFRGWEAEIVVWGVNTVEPGVLRGMLDDRAANNLVAGRPFATVTAMGPIGHVGASALDRLRGEAAPWWAARAGGDAPTLAGTFDGIEFDAAIAAIALDIANRATRDQMVAHGVYAPGAAALVGNRPFADLGEVAAVSGVGASTMRGLRDYAVSGAWVGDPGGGGPEEPPPSDPPPTGNQPNPAPPASQPDPNCALGLAYGDIFTLGAVVTIARRVVDPGTDTNATQRAQIVAAVKSAYPAVGTMTQAFAAIDGSAVDQIELWDASTRRALTAYHFLGAGRGFGMVFAYGTTTPVARVIDDGVFECTALWGDEMRPCPTTQDCADGLTCWGQSPDVEVGRCLDLAAVEHPANGNDCTLGAGCPAGSGLVCAGALTAGTGICVPAWMRGHFEPDFGGAIAIPDGSPAGVVVPVQVYGLASVDTDVVIHLEIDHPRRSDLRVTLTNPATAEVLVFDGLGQQGSDLSLGDHVVHGFSGDEMVNGVWYLAVVDRAPLHAGSITRLGLTITSRWD